jgi:biopolymer transport protein ExbD
MTMLSARSRPEESIPTSSMADIAFLLLIFFLVTTVFPRDKGLPIVLPEAEAAVSPTNVLHLIVAASGSVGIKWGSSPQTLWVEAEAVGQIWRRGLSENPSLIAAVRTDPDAAYGRMVDVLDQLQAAGARRVSLQLNAN